MPQHHEPLAIVGIGLRLPGDVQSPHGLWAFLENERDATGEVPPDRWRSSYYGGPIPQAGRIRTQRGAFLKDTDKFDALFFSIPEDQAAQSDPKHRMLLEVAWEALEDAGYPVDGVTERRMGVYVGLSGNDYSTIQHRHGSTIGAYTAADGKHYMGANRLSYHFNFTGPSISCDAACATGATALALACQSIWLGECSAAIVGAANDMHDPAGSISFSQLGTLSPDGRCKTFSANADGYGRGEAVVALVVNRLSAAEENGDHIYAMIRAVTASHNGYHEAGWAAPSNDAQVSLILSTLKSGGVAAHDLCFIEAHGTGTAAGDLAECQAIAEAMARAGRREPIAVGSVKSNFGHGEAAAGLTSVAKVALMLDRGRILPSIHSQPPNPSIDFEGIGIRVVTGQEDIPAEKRFAGVNSFGVGGSNVHILLERYDIRESRTAEDENPLMFPISAKSAEALVERLNHVGDFVKSGGENMADVAYTLAERRTHHDFRAFVVASERSDMASELQRTADLVAETPVHPCLASPELVFVFTGMGPQHARMGAELFARFPAFRQSIERFDEEWRPRSGWSIADELANRSSANRIGVDTSISMVGNVALQMALTDLWASIGIRPSAIIGHSVGEIAAAYASGAYGLDWAAAILDARVRAVDKLKGRGSMAAIALSEADLLPYLKGKEDGCSIAAFNGPMSLTIAGDCKAVQEIATSIGERAYTRILDVDVAFHGPELRARSEYYKALLQVTEEEGRPQIPYASSVRGDIVSVFEADYWGSNLTDPVRFASAMEALVRRGYTDFLEVGPHPVLRHAISEVVRSTGQNNPFHTASQYRDAPGEATLLKALGQLYQRGYSPKWTNLRRSGVRPVALPNYPWQRKRYWNESKASSDYRLAAPGHPLIGNDATRDLRANIDYITHSVYPNLLPWLSAHRIQGKIIFPGAAFIEMALAALKRALGSVQTISRAVVHNPLQIDAERDPIEFSVRIDRNDRRFELTSSKSSSERPPLLHLSGIWEPVCEQKPKQVNLAELSTKCDEPVDVQGWYDNSWRRGMEYGEAFQTIRELFRGRNEALARIELSHALEVDLSAYELHPTLLDGVFQTCTSALPHRHRQRLGVPAAISKMKVLGPLPRSVWVHTRLLYEHGRKAVLDIRCFDNDGGLVLCLDEFERTVIDTGPVGLELEDWLYREAWHPLESLPAAAPETADGNWLIVGGQENLRILLAELTETATIVQDIHLGDALGHPFAGTMGPFDGVICLFPARDSTNSPLDSCVDQSWWYANLLQDLVRREYLRERARVVVVTHGAVGVSPGNEPVLGHSGVWALNRVVANELPEFEALTIDLDPEEDPAAAVLALGVHGILARPEHDEYLRRDRSWYTCEIEREGSGAISPEPEPVSIPTSQVIEATFQPERGIGGVNLAYGRPKRLDPDQVRVRVHYAALNFRDLLKVLNEYPTSADDTDALRLGDEGAGLVLEVGSAVTSVKPGDRVVVKHTAILATVVAVSERDVFKIGAALSYVDAATIPVAFATAEYSLHRVANLQQGESCLIHSAASGVGLAAVQVALRVGADVYATAGTPEKRAFLEQCGIRFVMDSRTTSFEGQIREYTNGAGVDVVLNALAGEGIGAGLRCLGSGGRFLEIGKRDIARNTLIGLGSLARNGSFHVIDLARTWREDPDEMRNLLLSILAKVRDGVYQPLPARVFNASGLQDALRFMAKGTHIGKVVIDFAAQELPAVPNPIVHRREQFGWTNGTFLVTGGLGGLGAGVCQMFGSLGAKRVVILSRRKELDRLARLRLKEIEQTGTRVIMLTGDVSEEADVRAAVEVADAPDAPLRGVVHSAGVLEDTMLLNLTREDFVCVMRPKLCGAWNLHHATVGKQLEFFVMCSSAAVTNGNPGQANYVAANRFLDEFAQWRRVRGLPALAINWGAISDAGMSYDANVLDSFATRGGFAFHTREAAGLLIHALECDLTNVIVTISDWTALGRHHRRTASRFRNLMAASDAAAAEPSATSLRARIEKDWENGSVILLDALRETVAKLRVVPAAAIDVDVEVGHLGLDSLMRMELASWIRYELGLPSSAFSVQLQSNLRTLAQSILDELMKRFVAQGSAQGEPSMMASL
ncbi:MAG: SDR family NAD(P)-dependent oxidoreductase [Gemmatimonadota bacterium]